jgi:phosphopantetheinyl transferase (holo-ACP synthase)
MIVGLGLDICDIARVRYNLRRYGARFMDKILTAKTRAYCEKHRDGAISAELLGACRDLLTVTRDAGVVVAMVILEADDPRGRS